jgi:hypothetical protein
MFWEPQDSYGIARLDLPAAGTHGWQVRLQRRGVKYAKYFSDRGNGGPRGAYEAARRWRDELLEGIARAEAEARVCRRSPRNSSGVVGVSRVAVSSARGVVYWFWQATWSPAPGERRCVKFSVLRHGEQAAFRLAVTARREATHGDGD